MVTESEWFLIKADEEKTYGPVPIEELTAWAVSAKISPMDRVSTDGQNWMRAPMLPELRMDWLVELDNGAYLYGPTSVGTIFEFLESGEIDESVTVINCKENHRTTVGESEFIKSQALHQSSPNMPIFVGDTKEEVAKLKELVGQLRLELAGADQRYEELKQRYSKAIGTKRLDL